MKYIVLYLGFPEDDGILHGGQSLDDASVVFLSLFFVDPQLEVDPMLGFSKVRKGQLRTEARKTCNHYNIQNNEIEKSVKVTEKVFLNTHLESQSYWEGV